jgi:hypothetical protein
VSTETDVTNALLGSWPSQVAQWGREGIAAYLSELAARDITPDQALVAIRACPAGQKWPPSAPELAGLVRRDAAIPTGPEALELIFGRGGVLSARTPIRKGSWNAGERDAANKQAMTERAAGMHPLIGAFIEREGGLERLVRLDLDDLEYGEVRRHQLVMSWHEHVSACADRELSAIAAGRRNEGLQRLDPLAALRLAAPVAEITGGDQ